MRKRMESKIQRLTSQISSVDLLVQNILVEEEILPSQIAEFSNASLLLKRKRSATTEL